MSGRYRKLLEEDKPKVRQTKPQPTTSHTNGLSKDTSLKMAKDTALTSLTPQAMVILAE